MKELPKVAALVVVGMVALIVAQLVQEHLTNRAKSSPWGQMFKGGS